MIGDLIKLPYLLHNQ